jgi:hypothetical protein
MKEFTPEDVEQRKKAVFEAMSLRRQKQVLKRGYDKWDPFQEPKDPIDIRRDKTQRTTQMLVRDFLHTVQEAEHGNQYRRGVLEIALGIINGDERFIGMFEFSCWYQKELKRESAATD